MLIVGLTHSTPQTQEAPRVKLWHATCHILRLGHRGLSVVGLYQGFAKLKVTTQL